MTEIEVARDGAVQTITLNRPEKLNAFTRTLHEELQAALEEARDPAVRAVVITGAGRGFSAGQDLSAFGESGDVAAMLRATYHVNVLAIRSLEKPVVAAVNGVCAGAGLSLACACDIRVASDAAFFVPGFVGIGLIPDSGGTYFIQRLLGTARAFEWMTSNRRLTAAEAHAWGLVSEVVEAGSFEARVAEYAAALGGSADARDRDDEAALRRGVDPTLEEQLEREAEATGRGDADGGLPRGSRGLRREARGARSAGAEEAQDLAVLGITPELLLREDRLAVDDDVVLALRPFARACVVAVVVQLGRETRGPFGRTRFRQGSRGSRRPRESVAGGVDATR